MSHLIKYINKIKDYEATLPPPPPSPSDEQAATESAGMDTEGTETTTTIDSPAQALPEVEIYIFTLIVSVLLRYNLHDSAPLAAAQLVQRCMAFNRRSLDLLASRAYFALSLAFEKVKR